VDIDSESGAVQIPGSEWLVGNSEMSKYVRSKDWSDTPLGPIESWEPSLRTTVSLALNSTFPISIAWGPQHTQLYNDGYWPICADKHPGSMGQDFTECWASAWPAIGDAFDSALAGRAEFLKDQRMFLDRRGFLEETFFTFSFSPILDNSGAVAGLFHPVTETTGNMIAQRRTRALRDLTARAVSASSMIEGLRLAAEAIAGNHLDVPFALFYEVARDGRSAELVAQTGLAPAGPGSPLHLDLTKPGSWPLADVLRTGEAVLVESVQALFPGLVCEPYPEPTTTAFLLPITQPGHGGPACVLVAGLSPRLPMTEDYRSFCELLAGGISTVIANATAIMAERQRAEALSAIDQAKTAFFANVSHEFRTPLTLLLGPIEDELTALPESAPAAQRERLETAHRNSLRLLRLVNTLLEFARMEDGRSRAGYRPTDLSAMTTELAGTFRSACERAGLELVVDCRPLPEPVHVDHEMWEAIVLNLLSNAFKYTADGQIKVLVHSSGPIAELVVSDTGIGIPEDELPLIFDRFHRVPGVQSRTHEGTGIGLAFVQQLVGQHGGSVRAESRLGQGATFTVSIPFGTAHLPAEQVVASDATDAGPGKTIERGVRSLVDEAMRWLPDGPEEPGIPEAPGTPEASGTPEKPAGSGLQDGRRARVVWADDNADMRQYVTRLLEDSYEVEAVPDGLAALAAVRRSVPDLVLSDVMMPRLDGFGLLRELRADERTRTIPVILLSARAGEESRIEGLETGADDYLVKPFTARELYARIGAHVQLAELRRSAEQARSDLQRAAATASNEAQLRLITDAVPVLIAYVDADRRYVFNNRAYEELFGLSRAELRGRRVHEVWEPVMDRAGGYIEEALAGRAVTFDWSLPDGDAPAGGRRDVPNVTRSFCSSYVPDRSPGGEVRGFFAVTVDVTERVRAEAEIRRLNTDLERRVLERTAELAAANKDLEAFSYSVSHDLRAPLRAIAGFTRLLADKYLDDLPVEAQRYLQLVRGNARSMGNLIDDLLSFSRLGREPVAKAEVDVTGLVKLCLAEVRAGYPDHEIRIEVADLPVAHADLALLKQVWLNLLGNAVKYAQKRPIIEIAVGWEIVGGEIAYVCRDNGVGFDMRYAGKMFGVFQRLHRPEEYEGTGVGLAIVEQIIRRHGGRVWGEAELNVGAVFRFTLGEPDPSRPPVVTAGSVAGVRVPE
jgi:PAS domain S-box-containing protein